MERLKIITQTGRMPYPLVPALQHGNVPGSPSVLQRQLERSFQVPTQEHGNLKNPTTKKGILSRFKHLSVFFAVLLLGATGFIDSVSAFEISLDTAEIQAIVDEFHAEQQRIREKNMRERIRQNEIMVNQLKELPMRNDLSLRFIPLMRKNIKSRIKPQMMQSIREQVMQNNRK